MLAEEKKLYSDYVNDYGIILRIEVDGDDEYSMKLRRTRKKMPPTLANPKKTLDDTICKN